MERADDVKAQTARILRVVAIEADALHLGGTRLDFDELRGLVEGSPANLRLLVVDACRSGGVSRVKGVKKAKAFNIDLKDNTAAEGVAIMTSSAAGESSQESDRLRGSFFSHHLINALRIVVLAIVVTIDYELLNFQHDYTFYVIVYGWVFLLWAIWVKRFAPGRLRTSGA